jgi:hypothetical protein
MTKKSRGIGDDGRCAAYDGRRAAYDGAARP